MIRVTVELVPYGDEEQKEVIGTLVLANTKHLGMGRYEYHSLYKVREDKEPTKIGPVVHRRNDGIWVLLQKILTKKSSKSFSEEEDELFTALEDHMV